MKAIHRNVMYSLSLAVLSLLVLQGCMSTAIEVQSAPGVATTSFETDRYHFLSTGNSQDKYSLACIHDTSLVLGTRIDWQKGRVALYDRDMTTRWSTEFPMHHAEYGLVWCRDEKIAVVTEYAEDDTLYFIGRHFDSRDGRLLDSNTIATIPMETSFMVERNHWVTYKMSPDSSKLLAMVSQRGERAEGDTDSSSYIFMTLSHDFTIGNTIRRGIIHDYRKFPTSIVNNFGEIFYTIPLPEGDSSRCDIVRLRGTSADTLSIRFPYAEYDDEPLVPSSLVISSLDNSTVQGRWSRFADDKIRSISTCQFDFTHHTTDEKVLVQFDKQALEGVIDEEEFDLLSLSGHRYLPSGNLLLVLHQFEVDRHHSALPNGGGATWETYDLGPLLIIMLDREGTIVWKKALKREGEVGTSDDEEHPACIVDNTHAYFFYRDHSALEGVRYARIALDNGAVHTNNVPFSYSEGSVFKRDCTMFIGNPRVLLIGLEGKTARLITMPLH